MKILVLSDSHLYLANAVKVIENIKDSIDMIFHLGDRVEDASLLKEKYSNIPICNVRGNCDDDINTPDELTVRAGGKKILLTHGHNFSVNYNTDRLYYYSLEQEYDACLFGHTHTPLVEYTKEVLIFNPGSISLPRGIEVPTYGILDIENGTIKGSVVGIYKDKYKVIM